MKKILYIILLLLFSFSTFAQSEHLKFRDIELNGSITDFIQKLEKLGYSVKTNLNDIYLLEGDFIGKTCEVIVVSSKKTKTVWKVKVNLPEGKSWYSLKSEYNSVKEQLTKKYGKPKDTYEFFSKPYYEGDGYELQALKKDKCTYYSYWEFENGIISLDMSTDCNLSINYEDKINVAIKKKEKDEQIQDDL